MTTKLIIIAAFCMVFAAGLVTGLQTHQPAASNLPDPTRLDIPGPTTRSRGPLPLSSFVVDQLRLSRDQSEKLKQIWTQTAILGMREQQERRTELRKDRDQAILTLVKEEAMEDYIAILQQYEEKSQELTQELQVAYDKAVEDSRGLLKNNTSQLERFERMLKNNNWDRSQSDGRGRGQGRGGSGGRGGPRGRDDDDFRGRGGSERTFQQDGGRATSRPAGQQ